MKSVPRASVSGSAQPEKITPKFNAAAARHDENAKKMQAVDADRLAPPIKEKFQAAARGEREKAKVQIGPSASPKPKIITRDEINRRENALKSKAAPAPKPPGSVGSEVARDVRAKEEREIAAMKKKLKDKSKQLRDDFERAR